jgi:hypothetical protein
LNHEIAALSANRWHGGIGRCFSNHATPSEIASQTGKSRPSESISRYAAWKTPSGRRDSG